MPCQVKRKAANVSRNLNGVGCFVMFCKPELREEIAQYVAAMRPVEKVAGPLIPFGTEVPVQ